MDYYSYYNQYFYRLRECRVTNCISCTHLLQQLDLAQPGQWRKVDSACQDKTLPSRLDVDGKHGTCETFANEECSDEVIQYCPRSCRQCSHAGVTPHDLCSRYSPPTDKAPFDIGKCGLLAEQVQMYATELSTNVLREIEVAAAESRRRKLVAISPELGLGETKEIVQSRINNDAIRAVCTDTGCC
eukprot:c17234_g1_i2.p3 GENE.c17234_g1_i2~~c17234_g1_i2.p3  ORF type:complete len:186 (+),score=32.29 c17234_g1_i2:999-1556(+)